MPNYPLRSLSRRVRGNRGYFSSNNLGQKIASARKAEIVDAEPLGSSGGWRGPWNKISLDSLRQAQNVVAGRAATDKALEARQQASAIRTQEILQLVTGKKIEAEKTEESQKETLESTEEKIQDENEKTAPQPSTSDAKKRKRNTASRWRDPQEITADGVVIQASDAKASSNEDTQVASSTTNDTGENASAQTDGTSSKSRSRAYQRSTDTRLKSTSNFTSSSKYGRSKTVSIFDSPVTVEVINSESTRSARSATDADVAEDVSPEKEDDSKPSTLELESEESEAANKPAEEPVRATKKQSILNIVDIEPPVEQSVPGLAHGLDRVLFNPGVYYLQDPRSHVYNFDPYLQNITPVDEFNYDALTEYITSSRDETLDDLARQHDLQIVGSTSSMTGVLAQFHFLISNWRQVETFNLSGAFQRKSKAFTISQRAPASIYLRHNDGVYSIDADKSFDEGDSVLSFLGRSMEKMLTLDPDEFAKLKKVNKADAPTEKFREAYHYSKIGKILMRSQLDCYDPRLPGSGVFDLKTRAVLPVRMDSRNVQEGAGYQIFHSTGIFESFEREYYDMIRAAFLKYSMQVRIGKMDGIFVAYHNTQRIFGFQYISLDEMDHCIHGSSDENIAQREFVMSLRQLDKVLQLAIQKFPGQSMALSFETREEKTPEMKIVVEPVTEAEIKRRQQGELLAALKAARQSELAKRGPSKERKPNPASEKKDATLEKMATTLEQMVAETKQKSGEFVKAALNIMTPQESTETKDKTSTDQPTAAPRKATKSRNRVMFTLKGTNMINGEPVVGPPDVKREDSWTFKYTIKSTTNEDDIEGTMKTIRERQAQAFTDIYNVEDKYDYFRMDLRRISDLSRIKAETIMKQRDGVSPVVWREASSQRDLEEAYRKNFSPA